MNDLLERMVKEAGFKVFGEKIVAADENSSGLATESVKRLVEIVGREARYECLQYVEGYLESAAESEDEAGLLMSAKPLLGDVRKMMRPNV